MILPYWVNVNWNRGKIIQKPRRERQRDWLLKAADYETNESYWNGIPLQVEGGYAYDKDLRDLVKRGLLKMVRKARSSIWRSRDRSLSTAILVLTDEGREAIRSGI